MSLRLEYEHYGSVITSDRLIQLSAITIDKLTIDYHKAEKTIVLDEPDIEIKVWTVERNVLGLSSQRIVSID